MKKILVLGAAALFVLGLSTSSWAVADFAIGGNVQLETSWTFDDVGDADKAGGVDTGFDDTTDFNDFMLGSSRINFKATVGDVTGFYELGIGSGAGISTRHAWAEWDAGSFLLKVGRTWGIVAFGFTDQQMNAGDANIGYGCLYDGRNDGLWITFPSEMATFVVEIGEARGVADLVDGVVIVDSEAAIPRIAAKADFKVGEMLSLTPSFGFQTYDLLAPPPAAGAVDYDGEDITTWAIALDGRVDLAAMYFGFEAWYGQNLGSGGYSTQPLTGAQTNAVSGKIEDIPAYGGFVRMVYPLEGMSFLAGVGAEMVDWDDLDLGVGVEDDNMTWSGYVAVIYNFTDNFWIQPEISYFDNGNDQAATDEDLGNEIWVGVHWQADF